VGKQKTEVLMDLPVADVIPTPDNPRTVDTKGEEFTRLLDSVKADGVRVRVIARPHPTKKGKWDLRAGARRLAAAKAAKLKEIPAIVYRDMDDKAAFGITFLENYARADLAPIEQGRAVEILMEKYGGDVKAVASKLGWTERGVRMCAKLKDLSTEWQKTIEANPRGIEGVSDLSVGHLALVARLPEKAQDDYLEWCSNTGFRGCNGGAYAVWSIEDMRKDLSEFLGEIKGMLWDPADETLVPVAGACSDCPKRSDAEAQKGLWDEEVAAAKGKGQCLDRGCWEQKKVAYLKRRHAELKAEHKALVCVRTDPSYIEDQDLKKAFGSVQDVGYGYKIVKKPSDGAKPCFVVHGTDIGTFGYLKETSGNGRTGVSGSDGGNGKAAGKPTPLKERRAILERKRWAQTVADLMDKIQNIPFSEIAGAAGLAGVPSVAALAVAFGTAERYTRHDRSRKNRRKNRRWDVYDRLAGNVTENEAYEALFVSVRQVLVDRLHTGRGVTQTEDTLIAEAKRTAELFGVDIAAMYEDVCTRKGFTEPKSWADLNADGTPKTKPKTKPKKKAAKKAAGKKKPAQEEISRLN